MKVLDNSNRKKKKEHREEASFALTMRLDIYVAVTSTTYLKLVFGTSIATTLPNSSSLPEHNDTAPTNRKLLMKGSSKMPKSPKC